MSDSTVFIGQSTKREELFLAMANRHGLVTGATGTGKTVTLQILAEGFCDAGVPVFAADVKGDLSGIAMEGEPKDALIERAKAMGFDDYGFEAIPTIFWDLFGEQGHPIRTTISDMGPLMLSRLMGLTDAQEGALNIAFRIADKEGLALLDLKDLRALLKDLGDRGKEITTEYGNVAAPTIGGIQRRLVVLEEQGGSHFFGEPALDLNDFMRTTPGGKGYMNVLAQMGNRIQHALRAYTPREQKAVATAASTFRPNPAFKTEDVISQLGKGEALVSVLDLKGVPSMVERTTIRPPSSRMGPITPEERQKIIKNSPVYGSYEEAEDRESAYEILMKRAGERSAATEQQKADQAAQKEADQQARAQARTSGRETATDRFVKNMASTAGRQIGNMLIRGILGGLKKW